MITEKAMLAAVHISIWTAVKHDRKVSRDVADQHGAHQGAGRYNKQLLRGADKLEELRTLAGRSGSTSTKSPFPGRTRGSGCYQRTFTSISWRACASSRPDLNRASRAFSASIPNTLSR